VGNTVNVAFKISNRIEARKCDWKWSKAPGHKPVKRRLFFKAQAAAMALRQAVSHNVIINKKCYIKSNQEVKNNSDVEVVTKAVTVDQCSKNIVHGVVSDSENVVHGVVSDSFYSFNWDQMLKESGVRNVGKVVRKEKDKKITRSVSAGSAGSVHPLDFFQDMPNDPNISAGFKSSQSARYFFRHSNLK
jgi:hypothetical protein